MIVLADITRVAERPLVADVIQRTGARAGGAKVDRIVEAARAGLRRARCEPVFRRSLKEVARS